MMNQSGFPLMNELVSSMNIDRAIEKVKKNKGAPGIDDMTVSEIKSHLNKYRRPFVQKLREGSYRPQPTKRVEIPKENGKKRKLSIPVVRDRVVQQMILQVITPLIDPTFSENSYGFRPGKSCQQAIAKAGQYYEEGYDVVVDCDLKSYFDTINHQKLMHRMQWYIEEKAVLQLIWNFLNAGVMEGEILRPTSKGASQGSPLSPLLANVYLDQLDKELERRNHRFIRYADDFIIFVQSERAAQRVQESITQFLEKKLRLTVNQEKSQIIKAHQLEYLSYRMRKDKGK
ncbi:group II intron reverse transcriptase/maturase [Tetragenococcus halophilus]|uniref:RNA-directed DNA polymerase n=1 Tax=Tetragenococcus halophilus TaxID=51669 RepID=A0AB37D552_TETHA|nr:group II intron reverse transcriptase/maturase [Tetragenococcus halophilus]QGP76587.1 group II intron reverse transcriptase/maturase [Tetragenococcus halophilus]QGP77188.1 group II intron reverse transcriptase/maturase [Tetragenococcus halophilus]